MKKILMIGVVFITVLLFGCNSNSIDDIRKSFLDAGYEEYITSYEPDVSTYVFLAEVIESGIDISVYSFKRDKDIAYVVEFPSPSDSMDQLEEGTIITSYINMLTWNIDDFNTDQLVRGKYLLMPAVSALYDSETIISNLIQMIATFNGD